LKVYDVLGREVAELVNPKTASPDHHEVSFSGSKLASGVYIYKLSAGDIVQNKKDGTCQMSARPGAA